MNPDFKKFLEREGLTGVTINSYQSSLNRINKELNLEPLSLKNYDLDILRNRLSSRGELHAFNRKTKGAASAAIKKLISFNKKFPNDSLGRSFESKQSPPSSTNPIFDPAIDSIINAGCFIYPQHLEVMLSQLKFKKNLILQGPPGTGKTWLAKKLGYALIGNTDQDSLRSFQFHPNLSYEDFIRGYRPTGDGKLALVDGPFLEAINDAKLNPNQKQVIVIEEINRGNPAQIFGEMLTLLESDKRSKEEALELSYRRNSGEKIYIPENLYVIGTMNIADRSLSLVDFALRRRFAFVDLKPTFNSQWQNWLATKAEINSQFSSILRHKMQALNEAISNDSSLGEQFCIGHSYVTLNKPSQLDDSHWFRHVVETEIRPLLEEYWFDDKVKAQEQTQALLAGI